MSAANEPAPDAFEKLVAAVNALLPSIESEIEQRKYSGQAEDWRELEQLVEAVREALP